MRGRYDPSAAPTLPPALTLILALALALAHPCSRQYAPANPAGHAHTPQVIAIVMSLPPLVLVDYTV